MILVKTDPPAPASHNKDFSERLKTLIASPLMRKEALKHSSEEYQDSIPEGNHYSIYEMNCAFKLIADSENWKNHISAYISEKDYDICQEACSFYTGSILESYGLTKDEVRDENGNLLEGMIEVEADGYYAAIGS